MLKLNLNLTNREFEDAVEEVKNIINLNKMNKIINLNTVLPVNKKEIKNILTDFSINSKVDFDIKSILPLNEKKM